MNQNRITDKREKLRGEECLWLDQGEGRNQEPQ